MMGLLKPVAAIIVLVTLVIGYYTNNNIPAIIEEPHVFGFFATLSRMVADFSTVGSILTFTDGRIFLRNVLETLETLSDGPGENVNVSDAIFDGVAVRIYRPSSGPHSGGGLIYLHGGGFIAATPRGFDGVCGEWARQLKITVVAVDYRKAPEHPSPVPLEDAEKAAKHFFKHAHLWNVDAKKIGVAGDSAGGTLAAALALKTRDELSRGQPSIKLSYLGLLYPLLQGIDLNLPSFQENEPHSTPFTRKWAVAGVIATYITGIDDHYMKYVPTFSENRHVSPKTRAKYAKFLDMTSLPGDGLSRDYNPLPVQQDFDEEVSKKMEVGLLNPLNFPLMAETLNGLPPTYVLTVESDTLRDDGLLFVKRLHDENIPYQHDHSMGGFHGMLTCFDSVQSANQTVVNLGQFIANTLDLKDL